MKRVLACLFLAMTALWARAGIPDFLSPVVVEPPFNFKERLLDLTAGFEQSRREGRPLLVYLGAKDCPPCLQYERWLQDNREAVTPAMKKLVVADIRTYIRGPELKFKVGDRTMTLAQWRGALGDDARGAKYPSWWLISAEGRLIRSTLGSGVYESVERYLAFIDPAQFGEALKPLRP